MKGGARCDMRDGFGGEGGKRGEVRYEWQGKDGSFIR